jgi:hypothetical protein
MLTISGHKGNANQNHTKFHLIPVRIATIKNTTKNKCCRRCRDKRNPHTLVVRKKACTITMEIKMEAPQKVKLDLLYDPSIPIPLLGIYTKERESGDYKGTCTPMFIAALFTIAKL